MAARNNYNNGSRDSRDTRNFSESRDPRESRNVNEYPNNRRLEYDDNSRNNSGNNSENGYNRDNRGNTRGRGGFNRGRGGNNRMGGNRNREEQGYNIEERLKDMEEQNKNKKEVELTDEEKTHREEYMAPIEKFDDLAQYIDLKIIRGVMAYGYETPSPIQEKGIKPFLGGYDLIAQAQSGTGKTATFCIGVLGNIDYSKNEIQAIVLAHTMELAQQIQHVFTNIGKYLELRTCLAVRSLSVRDNINALTGNQHFNDSGDNTNDDNAETETETEITEITSDKGQIPHVVIGTPGRVLDMINKNAIKSKTIKMLVLDEADELLSDGFLTQIKDIIGLLQPTIQIGLYSATMEPKFFHITKNFMRNPIIVLIKKEDLTLQGIKQFYIDCEKNEYKFDTLCDLYSLLSLNQTIIYCNYYQSVEHLTKKLQDQNFKVSCIHGSMTIQEREEAMRNFRNNITRVLISTDLLGRGIDVQQVSIVINYDTPLKIESYIHRIGRSGRYGRKGTAINLATSTDFKRLMDIERYYDTKIEPLPQDVERVLTTK